MENPSPSFLNPKKSNTKRKRARTIPKLLILGGILVLLFSLYNIAEVKSFESNQNFKTETPVYSEPPKQAEVQVYQEQIQEPIQVEEQEIIEQAQPVQETKKKQEVQEPPEQTNFEFKVPKPQEPEPTPEPEPEPKPEPEPEPAKPAHDLGIEKLYLKQDSENPYKFQVKVQVKNFGTEHETLLSLNISVGNKTRDYGPYNTTIKRSKTITSTWTLKEPGSYSIIAYITGYSNFNSDADEENNIKTITISLNE
jgi:hypothetical protein